LARDRDAEGGVNQGAAKDATRVEQGALREQDYGQHSIHQG
jgi:hypothetical protein